MRKTISIMIILSIPAGIWAGLLEKTEKEVKATFTEQCKAGKYAEILNSAKTAVRDYQANKSEEVRKKLLGIGQALHTDVLLGRECAAKDEATTLELNRLVTEIVYLAHDRPDDDGDK